MSFLVWSGRGRQLASVIGDMRRLVTTCVSLALIFASAGRVAAQGTSAGIAGTVRDGAGVSLGGITIEARHEPTGYVARITTSSSGHYLLLSLPLGGPYTVRTRALGFRVAERHDLVLTIGARPQVDFVVERVATQLAETAVRAEREEGRESRVGGSVRVGREQVDALPVVDRNFSSLAALSPMVGPQLSLGGQRWTSTDIRIDGAQSRNMLRAGESNGGPAAISLEAIREFEVNSDVFDAAQGRQGGGQVAAVTRFGTNTPEARLFTAFRNQQLTAARDYQGRPRENRQAQYVQSALALGGPLVRDRAHYFIAYERQDSDEPLVTGDVSTAQAQVAAGINRDSLQRILSILDSRYGTASTITQLGRLSRRPLSQNLFTRLDWQLSPVHRLTLRGTGSHWDAPLSGGVDQSIALREARSGFESRERQLLASLASTVGSTAQHELQLSVADSRRALVPEAPGIPRGFVQVRSLLPDGTTGNTTVQFGGNRLAPDDSREAQLQLLDRLTVQRGAWLLTVGTDNTLTTTRTFIAESQGGLFVFPSIAALQSGTPNRFTRTVPLSGVAPVTRQRVLELGAFAQGEWVVSDRVTVLGGLRWDATAFLRAPTASRAVDSLFHVSTGTAPRDRLQLQPRAQLVWRVDREGRDVVRLGAGLFAAQAPYYAQHNQLLYTGASLADIDLRGASVPAPDFATYRTNPSTVPGLPSGAAVPPAYVNVAGEYRAPRTSKALIAWAHRLSPSLTTTLAAHASRTSNGYHYVDLNLPSTPSFRLSNEGDRGVWVPASSIAASTGTTDVRNASRVAGYARVLELQSTARATSQSLTADVDYKRGTWLRTTLGYAWGRARDNSTYGCCLARTATTFTPVRDDPRNLDQAWASADLDTRHRIVGTFAVRTFGGIVASARYLGASGRPFSLVVDGDINGDEANGNDLAFLFDPDSPSTPGDVAASMRRVMAHRDNLAAAYIREHLGQLAGRNTLYTPWTHRVDARFSRRVGVGGSRYADVLVDIFNLGNLLNRQWGAQYLLPVGISSQNPVVNRVALLRVVGFDQAARRYKYTVNESAGILPRGGDPYQVQFGIRLGY